MAKLLNNGFYQSYAWTRCRQAYIASSDGLCERCKRKGIINAGRVVHHIIEMDEKTCHDPALAFGFDNLELVCQSCHEEIHRGARMYKFDAMGNVQEKR